MVEPVRTCTGCRTRRPQRTLVRLCRRPDGEVQVATRARRGRSAYVCPTRTCFDTAVRRRGLERSLARAGKVRLDAEPLWNSIVKSVTDEIRLLRRTQGPMTQPSDRFAALEATAASLAGDGGRRRE